MNLTQVAVNDNIPPHEQLINNGQGIYSPDHQTLAVTHFVIPPGGGLPLQNQRYFISGLEGNLIHRYDGKVREANAGMIMFTDITLAAMSDQQLTTSLPPPSSVTSEVAVARTQAPKQYVFNESGNIMVTWVKEETDSIPASVRERFAVVADYFVNMLKAITSTINPVTNQPYSIYDYAAIMGVINKSAVFLPLTQEDIVYTTDTFGHNFSEGLITRLLGLPPGSDDLSFAQGMVAAIGNVGLKLNHSGSANDTKVANLFFICEYLLGIATVSVVVVSCDAKENSQTFQMGPCFKETATTTTLTLRKNTYLFTLSTPSRQVTNQ